MSVASINGEFCERVRVCVPQHGAWYADVVMLADPALSGSVTLTIGTRDHVGTVYEFGTRGEQSFARIVAGAGAWGTLLPAKDYHNDAGVKRKLLAEDAARGAGETLETRHRARSRRRSEPGTSASTASPALASDPRAAPLPVATSSKTPSPRTPARR